MRTKRIRRNPDNDYMSACILLELRPGEFYALLLRNLTPCLHSTLEYCTNQRNTAHSGLSVLGFQPMNPA